MTDVASGAEAEPDQAAAPASTARLTLLLVSDDPDTVAHLVAYLAAGGLAEVTVGGLDAVSDDLDCIVLTSGTHASQDLDALTSRAPAAAVVVVGERDDASLPISAGAQDFLIADSLTPELLARSVLLAVERKRATVVRSRLRQSQADDAEKARLEKALLPTPRLRTDAVSCHTYYQPGRDRAVLGGDFYDIVEPSDGHLRAVIADVMGHGSDQAAIGVGLRMAWRALVLAGLPDDRVLPTLAEVLAADNAEGVFVTVCDVTLVTGTETVATVRLAGHPPPLLCANHTVRFVDAEAGEPLGVSTPDPPGRAAGQAVVPPGSSLLLFTDGLNNSYVDRAMNGSVGLDELAEAVKQLAFTGEGVEKWIPRLVSGAPGSETDDAAVVVLSTHA